MEWTIDTIKENNGRVLMIDMDKLLYDKIRPVAAFWHEPDLYTVSFFVLQMMYIALMDGCMMLMVRVS